MDVYLWRISHDMFGVCLLVGQLDPFFVLLHSCVYSLNPSDLRFSSLAVVTVLVRALALLGLGTTNSDYLPQ